MDAPILLLSKEPLKIYACELVSYPIKYVPVQSLSAGAEVTFTNDDTLSPFATSNEYCSCAFVDTFSNSSTGFESLFDILNVIFEIEIKPLSDPCLQSAAIL